MRDSINIQIVRFFRFMRIFRITLFSVLRIEGEQISALVAWSEDCIDGIPDVNDTQEVIWNRITDTEIDEALTVGEYAYDAGWITTDKLVINERELQKVLGWDIKRIKKAIDRLLQIRVPMINDGKGGDSFFLHI